MLTRGLGWASTFEHQVLWLREEQHTFQHVDSREKVGLTNTFQHMVQKPDDDDELMLNVLRCQLTY